MRLNEEGQQAIINATRDVYFARIDGRKTDMLIATGKVMALCELFVEDLGRDAADNLIAVRSEEAIDVLETMDCDEFAALVSE